VKNVRAAVAQLLGPVVLVSAFAGCARDRGNIADLRDALAHGESVTRMGPICPPAVVTALPAPGHEYDACLAQIATWMGSKTGFHFDPPDQASAATAALFVARDQRGEWVPAADAWLFTVRTGVGPGADALRLAMAETIAESAGALPLPLKSDDDARALMRAVASSMPGACDTYARLGTGTDVNAGPPERTADHSACVQKDLERTTGPTEHGKYGTGLWRGAIGALALWKEAGAALHQGAPRADRSVKSAVEARVAAAEAVLSKVVAAPTDVPPEIPAYLTRLSAMHADAGALPRAPPLPALARPTAQPAGSGP
jgi:hypothetical protein